jgi:hypothetical protein
LLADVAQATLLAAVAAVTLAWITRPADDWMDKLCSRLNTWIALPPILTAGLITLSGGTRAGVVLLAGTALIVRYLHRWMNRIRGGITLIGFITAAIAVEIFALLILGVLK